MKIVDVIMESYEWKRQNPIRNGMYVYDTGGIDLIKVLTDEGITGIGLSVGVMGDVNIGQAILNHFKKILIGENPLNSEKIWDNMWQPKLVGRRGITTRVISGIDIALWDLKGKIAGLPLNKLIGGFADKIPVYIAGGYYQEGKGLSDLVFEMEEAVKVGAKAVKMKIGGVSIQDDVERVRVVRETLGDQIDLMVDANCAYKRYDAIKIAKEIEKYDIFWFEEPINPDDYKGHKIISQSTSIPIATGENEYTKFGFRDLIEQGNVSILQPDALIMGGVTEFMKVAAMSQAHEIPIAPHGSQDVHIHLVTAIPNGLILEYYAGATDPMYGKTFKYNLDIKDGYVHVPDRSGLGIEIDEEMLSPFRVA